MSNRKNKYINKDDYTSIMNNMSNSDVNKDDTPVSTKTMKKVLITIYVCSILFCFYAIRNFILLFMARNNEKTPKIKAVIYILLTGVILILLRNIVYISHKISKFIENNLLFKI